MFFKPLEPSRGRGLNLSNQVEFGVSTGDIDQGIDQPSWLGSSDTVANRRKTGESQRRVEEGGFEGGGVGVIKNHYHYGVACWLNGRSATWSDLSSVYLARIWSSTSPWWNLGGIARRFAKSRWRWKILHKPVPEVRLGDCNLSGHSYEARFFFSSTYLSPGMANDLGMRTIMKSLRTAGLQTVHGLLPITAKQNTRMRFIRSPELLLLILQLWSCNWFNNLRPNLLWG